MKIALCQYAALRATNAVRLMPEAVAEDERRVRVWSSRRAGLAEGVRNSPLELLTKQEWHGAAANKRQRDEEVAAARQAPPGQRVRRLLALM